MMVSKYQKARIFSVLVLVINANIKTQCESDTQCVVLAMITSTVITVKNRTAKLTLAKFQLNNKYPTITMTTKVVKSCHELLFNVLVENG